jgi:hypothetical protein
MENEKKRDSFIVFVGVTWVHSQLSSGLILFSDLEAGKKGRHNFSSFWFQLLSPLLLFFTWKFLSFEEGIRE